jgi:hypothetical protein
MGDTGADRHATKPKELQEHPDGQTGHNIAKNQSDQRTGNQRAGDHNLQSRCPVQSEENRHAGSEQIRGKTLHLTGSATSKNLPVQSRIRRETTRYNPDSQSFQMVKGGKIVITQADSTGKTTLAVTARDIAKIQLCERNAEPVALQGRPRAGKEEKDSSGSFVTGKKFSDFSEAANNDGEFTRYRCCHQLLLQRLRGDFITGNNDTISLNKGDPGLENLTMNQTIIDAGQDDSILKKVRISRQWIH